MSTTPPPAVADLVVVGGGAAGLMAAIHAGRSGRPACVLEGARTLGAKILVAGGGRCNVTHDVVDETSYAGSTPNAIRKVLRRFDVPRTLAFFRELGVEFHREESGKLFPVTNRARTVLDALLRALAEAGSRIHHPCRVDSVEREGDCFVVTGEGFRVRARRLVLATGGKSLPKSGSDGKGWELARSLGHGVTPRILPALVGLTLAEGCFVRALSGLTLDATLEVRAPSGKRLATRTASTLCTHFGISGPGPMDISRHLLDAQLDDPAARLVISWLPGRSEESLDAALRGIGARTVLRALADEMPERLARALCREAAVDPATAGHALSREARRNLVRAVCATVLPVTGTRGWNQAEATAGGVPLAEVDLRTMESRVCPGLHLCGEMLDVDGRIGGYNFQWAWASGYVAGTGAAKHS
jgi:predicted Rossmann fold flavoprotein